MHNLSHASQLLMKVVMHFFQTIHQGLLLMRLTLLSGLGNVNFRRHVAIPSIPKPS
ncbi:hypothetical protein N657DRAFT_643901 [Parathielavia appendiculata]|uniref:Uncharacterized protein n=1 Tax=Parathielavia appendiculata TaxID=2587402 RepID=A0AAN6Z499_9PEZI|nr:hypothetical protein N657DRAFT_643901 [Parathielavia appendiculata]